MSKRYKVKRFNSCYSMNWVDNKTNKELTALEVEEILYKQEKRIAELEKQVNLSRAMERVALKICKELEEFYKQYSARISNLYDTPLFATGTFGTFKILSVEEYDDMKDKISNLEKQLAEKEKEIESLRARQFIDMTEKEMLELKVATQNQDKISFAVEQLEKVKELLNTDFESIISWIDPYEYGECLNSMTYNHKNTIEIIDNQINELKRFFGDRK